MWVPPKVTTFKVRTVRSQPHSSGDRASAAMTWANGTDNDLDAAAGGQGKLLSRAMSGGGA